MGQQHGSCGDEVLDGLCEQRIEKAVTLSRRRVGGAGIREVRETSNAPPRPGVCAVLARQPRRRLRVILTAALVEKEDRDPAQRELAAIRAIDPEFSFLRLDRFLLPDRDRRRLEAALRTPGLGD